jgi:MoxR-like ATPase
MLTAEPRPASDPGRDTFSAVFHRVADHVERVVRGKRAVVELALTCLFAEGHLLVEDVPGVGKTTLARCLAAAIGGELQRVQFTADLLPSDLLGVSVFHPASGAFEFHPGPVFGNVVLGDEINRASPKTQSALLEVMEESRVTVDGTSHPVPRPFMVLATQNPVEMGGTYPLPEAQLDRFMMRVSIGYPDHAAEIAVLRGGPADVLVHRLPWDPLGPARVAMMIEYAAGLDVAPAVYDYVVGLVTATRSHPDLGLGASPRAGVALLRASRVAAAAAGRDFVVPGDVKALAPPVLAHRLATTPEAELRGVSAAAVVAEVLAAVPVPGLGLPVPGHGMPGHGVRAGR